ncbi:hypothetical protein WNY63_04185 [Pseudoalteromonas neustonica]|uniref:TonB C-terminal domain-containing protein n=2 Tax=Pseudoalteromonas TaxID=53246 RepID=A0A0N1EMJ2_9GAMM|nr:hypothetical protein [Pseudoalteromonas porphyrae]KPH64640.1 hypothetical protein ADS77_05035 [Pseudoalteromonas porphyrae]
MKYLSIALLAFSFSSHACMPSVNIDIAEVVVEVSNPVFEEGMIINAKTGKVTAKIFFNKKGKVVKIENLDLTPSSLPLQPIEEALYSSKRHFSSGKATSHDITIDFPIEFREKIKLQLNLSPPVFGK